MNYRIDRLCFYLMMFVLAGCSSTPNNSAPNTNDKTTESSQEAVSTNQSVSDPFESVNRRTWSLNYDYLDPYVLKPVSLAYVHHVPSPLRKAIANFFSNLDEPASMINNLAMGNGRKALDHFNRFWMNSTFGLFGLIDIASEAGIIKDGQKGFGDVLGHYGVGNGPYLMLPAAGPYTPRGMADFVDETYAPLSYLNIWAGLSKHIFEGMETRAALADQESMLKNSPDPYALIRDIYIQHQDFKAEIKKKEEYDPNQEELFDQYLDNSNQ